MKLSAVFPAGDAPSSPFKTTAAPARKGFAAFLSLVSLSLIILGLCALGGRFDRFLRRSEYFEIARVRVEGASPELEARIREIVGDMRKDRDNLLMFQVRHARFWLDALPLIGEVKIEKAFPDSLIIKVRERERVAVINVGDFYWIDRDGVILSKAQPAEVAKARAAPVTGLRAARFAPGVKLEQPRLQETLETIRFLKKTDPQLLARFAEWHISPRDEVVGVLEEGVEVRFGDADPITRLPALVTALKAKEGELARLTYLDLRFEKQVVYF